MFKLVLDFASTSNRNAFPNENGWSQLLGTPAVASEGSVPEGPKHWTHVWAYMETVWTVTPCSDAAAICAVSCTRESCNPVGP